MSKEMAAALFSLEMPIPSITERYQSIVTGASGSDIEATYESNEPRALKIKDEFKKNFIKELNNLFVIPTRVSISDISDYINLIELEHNVKIGVVGIDYLGLMDGKGLNEYEIISKLSRDIKTMAKQLNLPVILLSQVNRKGGEGQTEITLDMARGSGAIEEGADFVLGLYQVEKKGGTVEEPESEYDLICKVLKNRKGAANSQWKLELDVDCFRIGSKAEKYIPVKKNKGIDY
ncbi:MAG TPA: DnaB-like helicase C-terminal domain-containing protein [Nitrospinota bacterium]|nr:DnaB-like helicase C-terminal domain-containing protein [Nitrospinota bacterium]|tara:strand:- start:2505 stop:3206 length:702 start_codon:yes stop_codon:yes gene_type:complete